MTTAVLFTLALLPVYLIVREPFRRLPLHIDTGFYVSNHTIVTGRFRFSQGWNAHFAGCSKLVPEVFYSLVYLLHGRRDTRGGGLASTAYKGMSRLYASAFNYLTAIIVGVLAWILSGGDARFYFIGLTVFALLSSEPHWGVYFECGELFEILVDGVAVVLAVLGLEYAQPWWVGLAAFVWAAGSCFIKLSSAVAFVIMFGGLAYLFPPTLLPIACGGAAAEVLYVAWILWNRRNPVELLRALYGHESSYNQWADWRGVLHRYREKFRGLVNAVRGQPVFPALAIMSLVYSPPLTPVFWLYAAGVVATYCIQAADCRYYLIPLLPPIALLAGAGAFDLISLGAGGVAVVLILGAVWLMHNPLRAARLGTHRLNRWCWKGSLPLREVERNRAIERATETLRPLPAGERVLVYGPLNQAYVLVNASYVTPIVTPEYYLDHVRPGWQKSHNARLLASPPEWIMDTSASFAAKEARERLGLDYRLRHVFSDDLLIYELLATQPPCIDYENALTFHPQSRANVAAERALAGEEVVLHWEPIPELALGPAARAEAHGSVWPLDDLMDDQATTLNDSTGSVDPAASALATLLADLAGKGYRRLGIYGAGRFTLRHAELYRRSAVPVAVVLDDNAVLHGGKCLDWPVRSLDDLAEDAVDAIILSTDRFAGSMLARVRRRWGDRVHAFTISP